MNKSLRTVAIGAALAGTAFTAIAIAQENPMVGGAAMFADRNIIENAVNSADHTTLVAAVTAAGLVELLLEVRVAALELRKVRFHRHQENLHVGLQRRECDTQPLSRQYS